MSSRRKKTKCLFARTLQARTLREEVGAERRGVDFGSGAKVRSNAVNDVSALLSFNPLFVVTFELRSLCWEERSRAG